MAMGRFSKDFFEVGGLRSRRFQLQVDSTVRGIMKRSVNTLSHESYTFQRVT